MVRLISEEHIDYIRYAHQVVCMGIVVYLLRDSSECPCISDIVRILDDDFLACDVTLLTQSEETYEEESVGIHIEYSRVFVGLIGDECGERDKDSRCESLTKPYRPLSYSRHSVACIVEDKEDDEDQYRYYDRQTESALTDNCSKRCANKEEDETGKRQCKLIYLLYSVLSYYLFSIFGNHFAELQFGGNHLHTIQ